jgi:hypothetical protein
MQTPALPSIAVHLLTVAVACAGAVPALAGERISVQQFESLHRVIKPQPGESKWATIPWRIDLLEARRQAVADDKPLFVWRSGGGEALGRC